jgi:hypothetical protein
MDFSEENPPVPDTPLQKIQRNILHFLQESEIFFEQKITWKEPGFDLRKRINETEGLVIELGGPSDNPKSSDITDRYRVLGLDSRQLQQAKKLIVTNVTESRSYDELTGKLISEIQPIDAMIDATHLPFPDTSLGAVLMTKISRNLAKYQQIISETGRCLKPGGLLVWQGIEPKEIAQIEKFGFVQKQRTPGPYPSWGPYSVVFEKLPLPVPPTK